MEIYTWIITGKFAIGNTCGFPHPFPREHECTERWGKERG